MGGTRLEAGGTRLEAAAAGAIRLEVAAAGATVLQGFNKADLLMFYCLRKGFILVIS